MDRCPVCLQPLGGLKSPIALHAFKGDRRLRRWGCRRGQGMIIALIAIQVYGTESGGPLFRRLAARDAGSTGSKRISSIG
eukprot:3555101-Alexandrium_andersonii.AAC.1